MAYIIINPDKETSNKSKSIEIHNHSKKVQKNNKLLSIFLGLSVFLNLLQLLLKYL